ncbi:hypothetical protein H1Z61_10480 [Bacillus aquiflavi]|uniref:GPI inositol-deacylase PGAP1-like alpha/beta domain-containing protein n=1 Tax=Bacillus aquiflavi TaxID=2672567 RepID=A0A6B3W1F5_9BACI|nr:hypothetical protein [Bacillus aquiflavi]MBA4537546.1 hypothetical protein [Bacillus aquiflavi]NEY81803.1 hypothetical protein [Bacillus aquiflavi]
MKKKILLLLLACLLALPLNSLAGSFKGDPKGEPGEWYLGLTPENVDPAKSPIVFVHGFNSSSHTWWEGNDMYDIAYQNGYETAFIDLYPYKNMWDNGALLAEKLREIYNHFGKKLVVVAHSKGGIDTQTALVHYNAYPYVNRVITLGSPHHGSQIADLAYSSWAGWLADILGSKNDATYSLQTGYMANFRNDTDRHSNVSRIPFYTFAGTSWGSFGGALYWGGLYLRQFGQNDGLVTVASSRLPYATEIKVDKWDHSTIRKGSSTFSLFQSYLGANSINSAAFTAHSADLSLNEAATSYIHGGKYNGRKNEQFLVEDGVDKITVNWLSDQKSTNLTLQSPSNKKYGEFKVNEITEGVFKGAYEHTLEILKPEVGQWNLAAKQLRENYLLNVHYDSDINQEIEVDINANKKPTVSINSKNNNAGPKNLKADVHVKYMKNNRTAPKQMNLLKQENQQSLSFTDFGEGVYNFTIDVNGVTENGQPFNRSIVKSVYIDSKGNLFEN